MHTVKGLLEAANLLEGDDPLWKPAEETSLRSIVDLLQQHLKTWRQAIIQAANDKLIKRTRSGGEDDDDDDDGGRKRNRKRKDKKKRKSRDSSGTSSSESSEEVKANAKDASHIISQSKFKMYGLDLLPDAKLVLEVAGKNKQVDKHGVQYVSNAPLEEWVPGYIGRELPRKAKKTVVKARKDIQSMSGPIFMEHWMAFWLTHGAAGVISPEGFASATALTVKMTSEKGPAFALQYFRQLIPHIQSCFVACESGDSYKSLDGFIKKVVPEVDTATNMHFSSNRKPPFRPGEFRGAASTSGNNARATETASTKPAKFPRSSDQKVCIFHDPAKGRECRNGDRCGFQHVDTRDKAGKRRHEEAAKEASRFRKRS